MKKLILALSVINLCIAAQAQPEESYWYFGENAGLHFHNGTVTPVTGSLVTNEGCASASDACGNLLFYTDGRTVWNKNHLQMPNGSRLDGHISSTQSALIVKQPHNNNIYYIFTSDATFGNMGIRYSIIDLRLNDGLGDITQKNIFLRSQSCEKLAGIRHSNGSDVWVLTHDDNSDVFCAFLVDSNGVKSTAIESHAGMIVNGVCPGNAIGYMKASKSGRKIAYSVEGNVCSHWLFNFDPSTGLVINDLHFPSVARPYGVEFSPNENFLYLSTAQPYAIWQYNLTLSTDSDIINSVVNIAPSHPYGLIGALQMGPDGKIYVAQENQTFLGVINQPDAPGLKCQYKEEGVALSAKSIYGLPNFINNYPVASLRQFTVSNECLMGTVISPKNNGVSDGTLVAWNFGDPISGANNNSVHDCNHIFSTPGIYRVTLVMDYGCGHDTSFRDVVISPVTTKTVIMWGSEVMHKDQHAFLGVNQSGSYAWSTGETTSSITIQPACKDYSVFITTPARCTYSAQKKVTVDPPPSSNITAYKISEFSAQLQAGEGSHYQWTPSDGLSCYDCRNPIVSFTENTRYCVKTTDAFSCITNTCISLVKSAAYIPNGFTPNDDRLNEVFLPVVTEVKNYQLKVYDRSGQKLFETDSPEVGWDGRFRGQPCERGVYVYALEFTDIENNRFHQYSGTVTLTR